MSACQARNMGFDMKIKVLFPSVDEGVVELEQASAALAPRLVGLTGRRVALLDNSKPNAGELLRAVYGVLNRRFGLGEVRGWRKQTSAHAAPFMQEILQWKPDFVLTASGD